jgi:hypothetical protein
MSAMDERRKPMRSGAGTALGLTILVVDFALIAYFIVIPNYTDALHRAKVGYVRTSMRDIDTALETYGFKGLDASPEHPYWGPVDAKLLEGLKLPPERFVDPYNQDPPESAWRTGPLFRDDRASFTPRGGDLQCFWNGDKLALLVSRGPDRVLSLTPEAIQSAAASGSDRRSMEDSLFSFRYDPSNGTISAGDLWRQLDL